LLFVPVSPDFVRPRTTNHALAAAQIFEFADEGFCRYCSKPACRKESKAQSQRRWQQRPENQNYFRGPENRQRVKDWRKVNPSYWRKKKSSTQVPLQDFLPAQVAHHEELNPRVTPDALQDLCSMQPAMVVGLISIMTGSALQEDIAATVGVLLRKGRDILDLNPGSETTRPYP
jgi:hypothetical protein